MIQEFNFGNLTKAAKLDVIGFLAHSINDEHFTSPIQTDAEFAIQLTQIHENEKLFLMEQLIPQVRRGCNHE